MAENGGSGGDVRDEEGSRSAAILPPPPDPSATAMEPAAPASVAAVPSRRAARNELPHLGKYRFIASLGHGGMAEVFLAVAIGPAGFNKLQVIKRLRPNLAEEPELCTMFLDEARLAARLNHRNVVQTNEVDLIDGQYFMAMEYLEGQPLGRIMSRLKQQDRRLPPGVALRIVCEALGGLHYAHELADYDGAPLRIVHRDVSPQNVFVTYDGQVKIVDFGIAKAARRVVETQTGVIKGKVAYMAPEQAFSSSEGLDRRADLFSVGVILWEALAERRLWQGLGDPEIIASLLHDIPRVAEARPDVPPALARICDKALARAPEERYATAIEMRAELERAGDLAPPEEVGALVEKLFHDHRAELRARLAQQIDLVEHDGHGALLELDRLSFVRVQSSRPPPSRPPPRSSDFSASSETPATATLSARRPGEQGPASEPMQSALWNEEPRAHVRSRWLMGSLLIAAVAGVVYLLVPTREAPPAAASGQAPPVTSGPTAPASITPAVVAPSNAAATPYVQIRVAANPLESRILVDGLPVPSNPFDGRFLKDGAFHRVQIEASGFTSQSRLVKFDKDQAFDVALLPKPKAAPESTGMKPNPYK